MNDCGARRTGLRAVMLLNYATCLGRDGASLRAPLAAAP
jgi:hypothetical protein